MNTLILQALSFLYAAIAVLEIASEVTSNRTLHLCSKPFLIILVLILFLIRTHGFKGSVKLSVIAALVFSWLGDVLLMFTEDYSWTFLGGLGAFLVAHCFLIVAYRIGSNKHFQLSFFYFVPVFGYGIVLYSVLAPYLGTMLIPVAAYSVVLLSMLIAALERGVRVSVLSFRWVLTGAVCFVMSDSILAWQSFVQPSVFARVALMTLYIAAQYAIAQGMALHITEQSSKQ